MAQDMYFVEIKVGDYAKCYDQSYAVMLLRNDFGHPTWSRTHNHTLIGKTLKVMDTYLKVPVMGDDMRSLANDSDGRQIYLDTMISDGSGGIWLVQGRFLDIQE